MNKNELVSKIIQMYNEKPTIRDYVKNVKVLFSDEAEDFIKADDVIPMNDNVSDLLRKSVRKIIQAERGYLAKEILACDCIEPHHIEDYESNPRFLKKNSRNSFLLVSKDVRDFWKDNKLWKIIYEGDDKGFFMKDRPFFEVDCIENKIIVIEEKTIEWYYGVSYTRWTDENKYLHIETDPEENPKEIVIRTRNKIENVIPKELKLSKTIFSHIKIFTVKS